MKSCMKAALGAACLVTPMAATASDCAGAGAQTHEVSVLFQGFFPSTIYVCPGDTIDFVNRSGRWAGFNISDGGDADNGNDFSYYWTGNGATASYLVNADSGTDFHNFDLWGANPNYDGDGKIVFGVAPNY